MTTATELLDELEAVRRALISAKTEHDVSIVAPHMAELIASLVTMGVYPPEPPTNDQTIKGFRNSNHNMVMGWGARWHLWTGKLACPVCGIDWRDRVAGPPFKREILVVEHDRVRHVKCPDCGAETARMRCS
jgi:hypothetical protein